jgi:hypothetical protein
VPFVLFACATRAAAEGEVRAAVAEYKEDLGIEDLGFLLAAETSTPPPKPRAPSGNPRN